MRGVITTLGVKLICHSLLARAWQILGTEAAAAADAVMFDLYQAIRTGRHAAPRIARPSCAFPMMHYDGQWKERCDGALTSCMANLTRLQMTWRSLSWAQSFAVRPSRQNKG